MQPEAVTVPAAATGAQPPRATGLPLVGSVLPMFFNPVAFLLKEYQRLGPVFRLNVLHHRFTVLAGPEANAFMARTSDRYLSAAPTWRDYSREFGSQTSMPGVDGDPHYRLRRMTQRPYSRASLLNHVPEAAELALRVLREQQPGAVPLVPLLRKIVTQQLGTLLVGRGVGEYLDDIATTVRYSLNCTLTKVWPRFLLRLPRYQRAKARMLRFGQEVWNGTSQAADKRTDLIAELREAAAADPGFLSPADLHVAAMGPFVAGLDTVTNSCAFLLHALLKHPSAYQRVTEDADRLFAPGGPTAERLKGLSALRGAVQEGLRLYPISPVILRHVNQPFEFGGYTMQRGEALIIATTLVHFLPEFFPDPYRFDIDRYLPERAAAGQKPGPLCGFGLGPHTCLGSGFAEEQIALVIATLLHHARFTLDPKAGTPRVTRDPTPTLGPRYTVRLAGFRSAP